MDVYAQTVQIILILFYGMLAFEWIVSIILKKEVYRTVDALASMSAGLINNTKVVLKLTVIIFSHAFLLEHLALWELKVNAWTYVLTFLWFDFAYYWKHRWSHEINFLWNRHLVHHSSEEFNLSSGMRQPISGFIQLYFFLYMPLAVFGVPVLVFAVITPLHRFAQFWYHTRLINKMGFLERIIVTPSHHRVHHAINADYIDKNYSAIFIIWDKLFGTFQEETEDEITVYGIKRAVKTWNPFLIGFMHLWLIIQDSWRTKKWGDKIRVWYKPTGWRPDDMIEKYPVDYDKNASDQIKYSTEMPSGLTAWCSFQVMLHLLIQFHIIALLGNTSFIELLIYGGFIALSIFSYTSLMDRHRMALPIEVAKFILGIAIIYITGGWFKLDQWIPFASPIVIIYLLASLVITVSDHQSRTKAENLGLAIEP